MASDAAHGMCECAQANDGAPRWLALAALGAENTARKRMYGECPRENDRHFLHAAPSGTRLATWCPEHTKRASRRTTHADARLVQLVSPCSAFPAQR